MNGSFLLSNDAHYCCTSKHHGIDMVLAERAFNNLRKIKNENLKTLVRIFSNNILNKFFLMVTIYSDLGFDYIRTVRLSHTITS